MVKTGPSSDGGQAVSVAATMLPSRPSKSFVIFAVITTPLVFLSYWVIANWDRDYCLPGYFITISAHGRTGNKLCQYATLWGLQRDDARARPAWIMAEMRDDLETLFPRLELPVLPEICTDSNSRFRAMWYQDFDRTVSVSDSPRYPVLLSNWPCDLDRFHPHRESLLRQLTFRPEVRREAQWRLRNHTEALCRGPPACTYVAVHVRRTDYIEQVKYMLDGTLVGKTYLDRALALCRLRYQRPVFVVSSDDPAWVRRELRGPDITIAASQGDGSAGRDLALLAQCNHTVMTHGTYGFWAAYLAQGDVFVPSGFGRRDSWLSEMMQRQGLNLTRVQAF